MVRTLAQVRQQIETLEKEAESIKAKEIEGVIGRIREAIEFYGLTVEDLFEAKAKKLGRPKLTGGVAHKKGAGKKVALAKFKDPNSDKTWTGHGKRPAWFVEAMAAGKTYEELAVAP